ncbi:Uncharacterized protein APZ42_021162 [Daphnia magna]|uniref:Uncharacterized protein n=1 Tax=Daphnia magna TaxID=35525 RepID=A0A162CBI3_9CRUS|nr:Uncharacterized protein APZ42_021162 [Daphnia magna]
MHNGTLIETPPPQKSTILVAEKLCLNIPQNPSLVFKFLRATFG